MKPSVGWMGNLLRLKKVFSDEKVPAVLAGYFLLSFVAVTVVPLLTKHISNGRTPSLNQSVATSLVLFVLTAAYLYYWYLSNKQSIFWFYLALVYNSVIISIKFILSPAYVHRSLGQASNKYLFAGLVVLGLYVLSFEALHYFYKRAYSRLKSGSKISHFLTIKTRLLLVIGILILAFATRIILSAFLSGTAAADYLKNIFSGAGIVLPILLSIMALGATWSFEQVAHKAAKLKKPKLIDDFSFMGLNLIVLYHSLWLAYMINLFR